MSIDTHTAEDLEPRLTRTAIYEQSRTADHAERWEDEEKFSEYLKELEAESQARCSRMGGVCCLDLQLINFNRRCKIPRATVSGSFNVRDCLDPTNAETVLLHIARGSDTLVLYSRSNHLAEAHAAGRSS